MLPFVLVMSFTNQAVIGQGNVAHVSPNGIIVFTGYDIHFSGVITIEKGIKKRKKKKLATLQRVNDKTTFLRNLAQYEKLLPHLPQIPSELRDSLWERSQNVSQNFTYVPNTTLYYLSLGLAYFDQDVKPGESYSYAVKYTKQGNRVEHEGSPVIYGSSPELPIATYETAHFEGQSMRTKWNCPLAPTLHSFKVFRQDNDRGDYTDVEGPLIYTRSSGDTLQITCYDTTVTEHYSYKYFMMAVDMFSNLGPASDTITVNTFYYADLPYLKRFRVESTGVNRQLKVMWVFENKPYIRSIAIERSREFDRDYTLIAELPPTDTTYFDYVDEAHENYYYRLRWIGPDSVSTPTVVAAGHYIGTEVADSIRYLTATTIDDGVRLDWTDVQPFVIGYMVHRRRAGDSAFVLVAEQYPFDSLGRQSFIDTSAELTGNKLYEYYVRVVNDNYLVSEPSDTVQVRPGIARTLRSPTGLRSRQQNATVYLFWDDMQVFEPDLLAYKMFRMRLGEDSLVLVQSLNAESNHSEDKAITQGAGYGYAIKAIDRFGNASALSDTIFVAFPLARPLPPAGIKVFVHDDMIEIRWDAPYGQTDIKYQIYRSTNAREAQELASLGASFDRYEDNDIQVENEYTYHITTISKEGIESIPSEKIIVQAEINRN